MEKEIPAINDLAEVPSIKSPILIKSPFYVKKIAKNFKHKAVV